MRIMLATTTVTVALLGLVSEAGSHPKYGSGSTAYCLTGIMADGTRVRDRSVANNAYPLGTKLTIWPSPTGQRHFVVRDRIGYGSQLDFWVASCSRAIQWGRRAVTIKRGWH